MMATTRPTFTDAALGKQKGIMGVVNVTPDSFSDGGKYFDLDAAIEHGFELARQGADIIDVGGESSRPGAEPVSVAEELRRVIPVIAELSREHRVSIDTFKPEVAAKAIEAGATLVNDISATLAPVAAQYQVGWVAMHMQGSPQTMQHSPHYLNVVDEVCSYLENKVRWAGELGIPEVWIDPGIGFGKNLTHNLAILRNLSRLRDIGVPLLVGTSRKAFLGKIAKSSLGVDVHPLKRTDASVASCAWCYMHGADMMRVHDVAETKELLRLLTWQDNVTPEED